MRAFGFLLAVAFLVLPINPVFALGISPATLEIDALLPDTITTYTTEVSRGNPGLEQIGTIEILGEDPYTIIAPESVQMPVGQESIPIEFQIDTTGLATGLYRAKMTVSGKLVNGEQSVVSGAQMDISFSVTNDEVDTESIYGFNFQQDDEGVLHLQFAHENGGNIDTNISRIEVRALQVESGEYIAQTIEETYDTVPPYSDADFRVKLDKYTDEGLYEFTVLWYNKNDQLITSHGPERFYIDGVESVEGESTMKPVALIVALIAGIILFTGAAIILYRFSKIKTHI